MTRPVKFGTVLPFLSGPLGGTDGQADGAPPPVDCCTVDPTELPDRGNGENGGNAHKPPTTSGDVSKVQDKVNANTEVNATISTTLDATPAEGSLLVAILTMRDEVSGPTTPAGWTAVPDSNGEATADGTGGNNGIVVAYYKFAGAAESPTITITKNGSHRARLYLAEFAGDLTFDDKASHTVTAGALTTTAVTPDAGTKVLLIGAIIQSDVATLAMTNGFTEVDNGSTGGGLAPDDIIGWTVEDNASGGYAMTASSNITDSSAGIILAFTVAVDTAFVPAPQVNDGDDATYEEIDGPDVLRVDLGAPYRIVSTRLRIATEFAGARTYTIKSATLADFSDEALVATLNFTAVGSFTAQDVEASWYTTDERRYWHLEGNAETRRIHAWEFYEPTLATSHQHDASGVAYDNGSSGLPGDTVQEAIDELDAAVDALGSPSLDGLTDVTITSPVSGQRLRFNGSIWVNSSLRWEPHVDYTGSVVLDGAGNPVMVEVS